MKKKRTFKVRKEALETIRVIEQFRDFIRTTCKVSCKESFAHEECMPLNLVRFRRTYLEKRHLHKR